MRGPDLGDGCLLVACVALFVCASAARTETPSPQELLRSIASISDREWAQIQRGEPVAKIVSGDGREVAVVGAIRITADRDQLIARLRSVDILKRTAVVLDAATFSAQPAAADLARLPLEEHSLDLRDCRPGDCHVRLTADDIARFHREVNWQARDWRDRSAAVWRDVLAAHAAAYQRRGREALPIYANRREPLNVSSELGLLLSHYAFLRDCSPAVHAYLQYLGPDLPADTEASLLWTKEDFGIRPIIRISHQVIQRPAHGNDPALVTSNQVYADHYLDAALTVTLAMRAADDNGRSFYMISVNRARTRSLGGLLRTIVRSVVQNRSRDAMRKILAATKTALENED